MEFHPAISLPCGIFTVATGTYSLVPFFVRIMDSVLGLSPLRKKKGGGREKKKGSGVSGLQRTRIYFIVVTWFLCTWTLG